VLHSEPELVALCKLRKHETDNQNVCVCVCMYVYTHAHTHTEFQYTVRSIISAPPLQNAVSHTTSERMQLLCCSVLRWRDSRHFAAVAHLWLNALCVYIYIYEICFRSMILIWHH
jgi:hypothetical protein